MRDFFDGYCIMDFPNSVEFVVVENIRENDNFNFLKPIQPKFTTIAIL
jgi:hypothetical protein